MPLNSAYVPGLKRSRLAAGLTQQDLAEACGLTQTSIARWECERRPMSLRNRLRVAAALGVKPGELMLHPENFARSGNPQPHKASEEARSRSREDDTC